MSRHRAPLLVALVLYLVGAPTAGAASWSPHKLAQANGGFLGVSCPSPGFCMAVGSVQGRRRGVTLAETYDGASWSVVPTPNIAGAVDNELLSVSCSSPAACIAVGFRQYDTGATRALAEQWDGFAWSILSMPRVHDSGLAAVSCASPIACMAVGGKGSFPAATGSALVERWNGASWSLWHVPRIRGAIGEALRGISCATPTACTAVGEEFERANGLAYAVAVHWNGRSWRTQLKYGDGYDEYVFNAVSCLSARRCVAIGEQDVPNTTSYGIWARHRGFEWSEPRSSIVADNQDLDGLSCTGPRACVAVGGAEEPQAYAETWDGARWTFDPILSSLTAFSAHLNSVSCLSPTRCVAVGLYKRGRRPSRPLVALRGWG
jgi:hypothetical protein